MIRTVCFRTDLQILHYVRLRTQIMHCSTCVEVSIILNEAVARAERQAVIDDKIVSDCAGFMEKTTGKADCFYDVNVLPHPKDAIIAAIEREIIFQEPVDARIDWLKTGVLFLWNFQEGVGPAPLPLAGTNLLRILLRGTTPAELAERRRIVSD